MDIIDIILARALSPEGQTETYAALAAKAAQDAANAQEKYAIAEHDYNALYTETDELYNNTVSTLTDAENALIAVNQALANIDAIGVTLAQVNSEIDKLSISSVGSTNTDSNGTYTITTGGLNVSYPSGKITANTANTITMYGYDGNKSDGTMTQKAITKLVNDTKTALQAQINAIPSGGGNSGGGGVSNLGSENEGYVVIVGSDGNIIAGGLTEEAVAQMLIKAGVYSAKNAVGLEIDYANKICTRILNAAGKPAGEAFDQYTMFQRKRCNVADDGTINAFYGDNTYRDDGSNGQVMVYQPKFYYQRVPIDTELAAVGQTIKKEVLMLSVSPQTGFKVHPLFVNDDGEEVDYVLLSAYDSCVYDVSNSAYIDNDSGNVDMAADKLSSISGVKPLSGQNNSLTLANANGLANNRGEGWKISNMAAESANQMLEMVEFGSMNGQANLGKGVVSLSTISGRNFGSHTGSTASLGNISGSAASTYNYSNGQANTYTNEGMVAISYRGYENPWGQLWTLIDGIRVYGNGEYGGGIPQILNSEGEYESVGFTLPNGSGWISGMGYGNEKYDWVYMPSATSDNANSYAPVGDYIWVSSNLNSTHKVVSGGAASRTDYAGPFCYACDSPADGSTAVINPRLMFIPQVKDSIYTTNISKWQTALLRQGE